MSVPRTVIVTAKDVSYAIECYAFSISRECPVIKSSDIIAGLTRALEELNSSKGCQDIVFMVSPSFGPYLLNVSPEIPGYHIKIKYSSRSPSSKFHQETVNFSCHLVKKSASLMAAIYDFPDLQEARTWVDALRRAHNLSPELPREDEKWSELTDFTSKSQKALIIQKMTVELIGKTKEYSSPEDTCAYLTSIYRDSCVVIYKDTANDGHYIVCDLQQT